MGIFAKKPKLELSNLERGRNWKVGRRTVIHVEGVTEETLSRIEITAGDDCEIDLRGLVTVNSSISIYMTHNCRITFGQETMVNGALRCFMHEPSKIIIGARCLFGGGDLWTSDMHSILDNASGQRINPAADITLGDHVWLGQDTLVLKGSSIGNDSIVGARSVVAGKTFAANSAIAGTPARVIRSGVNWDFSLV